MQTTCQTQADSPASNLAFNRGFQRILFVAICSAALTASVVLSLHNVKTIMSTGNPAVQTPVTAPLSHTPQVPQVLDADRQRYAKPGADIELASASTQYVNNQGFAQFELQLESHIHGGDLEIALTGSDELTLHSAQQQWQLNLTDNPTIALPVKVESHSAKPQFLNVFLQHTDTSGFVSRRALAVKVVRAEDEVTAYFAKSFSAPSPNNMVISMAGDERIY